MPRILAVDFGEKRIGLATSDESGTVATPRRTLLRRSDEDAVDALERFCRDEEIALVLFGIPRSPDGVESAFAERIRSFAAKLTRRTGLPLRFHEETLTSDEAGRRLHGSPARTGLDAMAAAVLLEDYLQSVESRAR
ncbi:MAG TPA: Holliday junction resolvase RuvX [Thermoanaerobaculia bacterium]|jgi:putative Holliday junction resolvase